MRLINRLAKDRKGNYCVKRKLIHVALLSSCQNLHPSWTNSYFIDEMRPQCHVNSFIDERFMVRNYHIGFSTNIFYDYTFKFQYCSYRKRRKIPSKCS